MFGWAQNFLRESEQGDPSISPDGQKLIHFRSLLRFQHYLTAQPGKGQLPEMGGEVFAGIGGATPYGSRVTASVIARTSYRGLLPISLQPTIDKPAPWLNSGIESGR